jgi:predicted nucleic acid-binding Zn finger protein
MNSEQIKRVTKLNNEDFFLLNFTDNKFLISGSTKNVYTVEWFRNYNKSKYGSFFCNCPDMKSHAKKKNVYCKHICFVYNKIAKLNRIELEKSKFK